jgi:hypothetical protein
MDSSPGRPSGQGREAPGSCELNRAMPATPALNVPATAMSNVAGKGARTTRGTAAVPSRVTGATRGDAATFARSE